MFLCCRIPPGGTALKKQISIVVLCLGAHVALGGVIATAPGSGWADTDWISRGEVYQWGATARNVKSSPDTWEIGVGNNSNMTESNPATEAHLDWGPAGSTHLFVLDYDYLTHQVTWTVDGHSVVLDANASFSDMYIQLKARPAEAAASITNTTFSLGMDETEIDSFAASGDAADSKLQFIHLNSSEGPLSDMDFILEGTLVFDWSGAVPNGEEDRGLHIKMTQIPEPASIIMVILVSLTGMFCRRRFR